MKFLPAMPVALALLALGGCAPATTTPTPTTNVSFANEVVPMLKSSCLSCHGVNGSHGVSLFTADGSADYAAIKGGISSIVKSVQNGSMPPSGTKLTAAQLKTLQDWQTGGTPQN